MTSSDYALRINRAILKSLQTHPRIPDGHTPAPPSAQKASSSPPSIDSHFLASLRSCHQQFERAPTVASHYFLVYTFAKQRPTRGSAHHLFSSCSHGLRLLARPLDALFPDLTIPSAWCGRWRWPLHWLVRPGQACFVAIL